MPCGSSETCLEGSIFKIKPWGPQFSKASEHVFEAHWILWWRGVIPGALKSYIIQQEHHCKNNTVWNNYLLSCRIMTCVSLVNMEINYTYSSVLLKHDPSILYFPRKHPTSLKDDFCLAKGRWSSLILLDCGECWISALFNYYSLCNMYSHLFPQHLHVFWWDFNAWYVKTEYKSALFICLKD